MYRAGYELIHRFSEYWRVRNAFQFLRLTGSFVGTNVGTPNASGFATRSLGGFDNIANNSFGMQTDVAGRFTTGPLVHQPMFGVELIRQTFNGEFASATGPVPGIDIFHPDSDQALPGTRSVTSWHIRHDDVSFYVQDEIRIFNVLRVVGGGRFDALWEQDKDPVTGRVRRDQTFTNFAPRAGLLYRRGRWHSDVGSAIIPRVSTAKRWTGSRRRAIWTPCWRSGAGGHGLLEA